MLETFLNDPLYLQVDIALLGMLLGAAVSALLAFQRAGSFAGGIRRFWGAEELLFGGWAPRPRLAAGPGLFVIAAALLQFGVFFGNSLIREVWPGMIAAMALVIDHLYGAALVCKLLLASRYSGKQLAVAWPVFFVLRWVFMNNHNKWFMLGVLFLLAAKDVPLRRPLKVCLAVGAASLAVVMTGAALGWIPTLLLEGGRPRNSFGYGWPNLLGAFLLGAAVMYVCWRRAERLKWYDFVLLGAVTVFCDRGPDSRGGTVCLALLLAGMLAARFLPRIFGPALVRGLLAACPFLAFGASYWMHWAYTPDNALLETLNGLFTGRLYLGHEALLKLTPRIAGQADLQGAIIDNLYLGWWFSGGPVASLLVWAGFAFLLWKLLKNGRITESVCCLAFLAHGFMEPHLMWPCVNVTVWLLAGVVYLVPDGRFPSFAPVPSKKESEAP